MSLSNADILDAWLLATAEVDYRLEVIRDLIDQLPEGNTC